MQTEQKYVYIKYIKFYNQKKTIPLRILGTKPEPGFNTYLSY